MHRETTVSRRTVLGALAASAAAAALHPFDALAQTGPITRPIPSTGERLAVVGLGSWITFNVGDDPELRDECTAVMRAYFAAGGRLIDSSPMYGSAHHLPCSRPTRYGFPPDPAAPGRSKSPEPPGAYPGSTCCRYTTCSRGKTICRPCWP